MVPNKKPQNQVHLFFDFAATLNEIHPLYQVVHRVYWGLFEIVFLPKSAFLVLFVALFVACDKEPPAPGGYETIYLPHEARALFNATLGEVRIYKDSATGVYDTARCTKANFYFIKTRIDDQILFEEEAFDVDFFHTYYRTSFYYYTRLALHSDGREYFYVSEKGEAYLLRFPLVLGDSISDGNTSSYSVLKAFYPTLEIGNKTFENVYFIKRNAMSARFGSDADYYIARNKGIVAIREYKTNKLWILQ